MRISEYPQKFPKDEGGKVVIHTNISMCFHPRYVIPLKGYLAMKRTPGHEQLPEGGFVAGIFLLVSI